MDVEDITLTRQDIDDAIENLDPKDLEEEIEKAPKKLSVLCGGATGAGKSTLLNGLIGCKFDSLHVGDSLRRGTVEVTERKFIHKGITVTIWDTPGLERSESVDKKYLEEIKEKCADFDIFLYCIKADEPRAIELTDDRSSLLKFTKLFGQRLWENAVVALTFSNKIEDRWEEEAEIYPNIDVKREFKSKIDEWETTIRKALALGLKMDERRAKRVPVLPTGIADYPDLPGHDLWLSRLYVNFEEQMKVDAQLSILIMNDQRLLEKKSPSISSNFSKNIEDQDLVFDRTFSTNYIPGVSFVIGAALLGATIGALALGIPTFGVFAGVGAVVGGAIGGVAGASVSGVTYASLILWYARKKKIRQLRKEGIITAADS